jgi:ribonuclease-3
MAKALKMGKLLLLGRGEELSGGELNQTILAGVFEALVAAVFLDNGIKATAVFIQGLFESLIDGAKCGESYFDYKPRLQEVTQRIFKSAPVYRQVGESGPSHKKVFEVEVKVNGEVIGRGAAARKKEAEQTAAKEALEKLEKLYGNDLE